MNKRVIIFYDGECGFCNAWVSFFLKHNPGFFYFSPLQGLTAKKTLGPDSQWIQSLSTLVVLTLDAKILTRSSAALYLFSYLKFPWKTLGALKIIPRFVRDGIYRLVARTRYLWVKKEYCVLPSSEDRKYFLD